MKYHHLQLNSLILIFKCKTCYSFERHFPLIMNYQHQSPSSLPSFFSSFVFFLFVFCLFSELDNVYPRQWLNSWSYCLHLPQQMGMNMQHFPGWSWVEGLPDASAWMARIKILSWEALLSPFLEIFT